MRRANSFTEGSSILSPYPPFDISLLNGDVKKEADNGKLFPPLRIQTSKAVLDVKIHAPRTQRRSPQCHAASPPPLSVLSPGRSPRDKAGPCVLDLGSLSFGYTNEVCVTPCMQVICVHHCPLYLTTVTTGKQHTHANSCFSGATQGQPLHRFQSMLTKSAPENR